MGITDRFVVGARQRRDLRWIVAGLGALITVAVYAWEAYSSFGNMDDCWEPGCVTLDADGCVVQCANETCYNRTGSVPCPT